MPSFYYLLCAALSNKKRFIVVFTAINLIQAGEMALSPFILKQIIDTAVNPTSTHDTHLCAWHYLTAYLGIAMVMNILLRGYNYMALYFYTQLQTDITQRLHQQLVHEKTHKHIFHPGEVAKRIQDIATQCGSLCHITWDIFLPKLYALVSANYWIYYVIHPKFSAFLICWSIVFLCITAQATQKALSISGQVTQKNHQLNRFLIDSLSQYQQSKQKDHTTTKWLSWHLDQAQQQTQALRWFKLKLAWRQSLSINLLISCLLYTLVIECSQQRLSAGDFTFVMNIALSLIITTQNIGICMIRYAKSVGACHHNIHLLFQAPNGNRQTKSHQAEPL